MLHIYHLSTRFLRDQPSDGVAGEGLLFRHNQLLFALLEGRSDKQTCQFGRNRGVEQWADQTLHFDSAYTAHYWP